MYSGINGMKNFQTKLDVIGNNIANVNTYGFKKGRVIFKDMISQTISGATAGTAAGGAGGATASGGINPKQVGLGSQLSSIDTIDTEGSTQTTGRVLDVAIQGDGYIAVNRGTDTYYTRAGVLFLDSAGQLVNSSGDLVLDTASGSITLNGGAIDEIKNLSIGQDGKISYIDKTGALITHGTAIGLARFKNNAGLEKVGENLYRNTANTGVTDPVTLKAPGADGAGKLVSGALEMSNVDLSEEFTEMIVAQRGFQANTRIITTSDEILQELVNLKR